MCLEVHLIIHFDRIIDADVAFRNRGPAVDEPAGYRQVPQHHNPMTSQDEEQDGRHGCQDLGNDPL